MGFSLGSVCFAFFILLQQEYKYLSIGSFRFRDGSKMVAVYPAPAARPGTISTGTDEARTRHRPTSRADSRLLRYLPPST